MVEQLSIRSIKLRAMDGSVHIIPFSAVTTVTNMTRDFAFAVLDVTVTYGEDTDHVAEVLREIGAEMRAEPKFGPMIRDDIDVWASTRWPIRRDHPHPGEDRPASRWPVQREFNRRIKQRFDELGIEIPYPHQKLVIDSGQKHPAEDLPTPRTG